MFYTVEGLAWWGSPRWRTVGSSQEVVDRARLNQRGLLERRGPAGNGPGVTQRGNK